MRAYNRRRSTRVIIDMRRALLGIHGPSEEDYVICNIDRKESINYGQPFYNDVETGIDNIGTRRAYRVYWKQGSFHYWSNANNEYFLNHSDVKEWLFNRFIVLKKGGVWDTESGMWYSKRAFYKALRNHNRNETIDSFLNRVWAYQNR